MDPDTAVGVPDWGLAPRVRNRLGSRIEHEAVMRALAERQCAAIEGLAEGGLATAVRLAEAMGARDGVLGTGDATVPTGGAWDINVRAPYAGVAILNRSDASLTVVAAGRATAPGDGPGMFTVPPRSLVAMPLLGTTLAVYGTAGAKFSYTLSARPLTPYAAQAGVEPRATTPVLANVAADAASTTIRAANPNRLGLVVVNDSASATLYLALDGSTASTSNYSYLLLPGDTYEMARPVVTTTVTGIWSAAVGTARVTELT